MAYKQPRVPQLREGAKLAEYIRELVLFLKDFCMETWMAVVQMQKENAADKDEADDAGGMQAVTSVNGETGDVNVDSFIFRDERSVKTQPDDYNGRMRFAGLKEATAIGMSDERGFYSFVYGLRGWYDSSAGKAAEFAVNDGRLFIRSGYTTEWEDWRQIYDSANRPVPVMSELLDLVYPVGSVYMSVASLSPAGLFGGEWVQIKDVFLLAAGDSYSAGSTGGEETHRLTSAEMPIHQHIVPLDGEGNYTSAGYEAKGYGYFPPGVTTLAAETGEAGGSEAHNNMPPYLTVYIWKRTA